MGYRSRLIECDLVAGEIMVIRFERPEEFNYKAGQFCFITMPYRGYEDEEGLRKPFSIASSPLEKDLMFVARLTDSAFKRTLNELQTTNVVTLDSPVGSFTLPDDVRTPVVFLAGGIGIAPFRSMMCYAAEAPTSHRATLFYSSRVPEEAVFLKELQEVSRHHANLNIIATITRPEQGIRRWIGLKGRISPTMIKEGCKEWDRALYYVSGPPAMADGMGAMLGELGVGRDRIKIELWPGY